MRIVTLAAALSLGAAAALAAPPNVVLTEVASGFAMPLDIRFAPGITNRMFVVEKGGQIRIHNGSQILAAPFLDVSSLIRTEGERGLLGLAFHPEYPTNRAFYVFYTAVDAPGEVKIVRYLRDAANPDVADPASAAMILEIPHPGSNHNGGGMIFGPDGLLYVSVGDGGDGGFQAMSPEVHLGKILRIAVNGGPGYTIPAGNMYPAGGSCATTGCPEILHTGLRNPWRFSFDRLTGHLYIGDVGQSIWEEIDRLDPWAPPANFGWGAYEGNACYNDNYFSPSGGACAALAGHTRPVHTHMHQFGMAITGGFVYRGARIVGLGGYYLYGDYETHELWLGRMNGSSWEETGLAPLVFPYLSTFGEDAAGEIYGADVVNGKIYRFDPAPGAPNPAADADNDGVPSGVEGQEGLDPFVKDNDIFANPRLFAQQQYRDFLGREGEGAGIGYYVSQLQSGQTTRNAMIASFLASPEFAAGLPSIIRLYFAYFGRIPDYSGLIFQTTALRQGTPLAAIAQNFYNAPEFTNTYGSLTNDQYINLVYQNVLGRAPDPAGYLYYLTRLDGGVLTKGQMMIGFSESPEFVALMDNECWVISVYAGLLRRTPEAAGLEFYTVQLDGGTPRSAIIPGFAGSPEYHGRFLP